MTNLEEDVMSASCLELAFISGVWFAWHDERWSSGYRCSVCSVVVRVHCIAFLAWAFVTSCMNTQCFSTFFMNAYTSFKILLLLFQDVIRYYSISDFCLPEHVLILPHSSHRRRYVPWTCPSVICDRGPAPPLSPGILMLIVGGTGGPVMLEVELELAVALGPPAALSALASSVLLTLPMEEFSFSPLAPSARSAN